MSDSKTDYNIFSALVVPLILTFVFWILGVYLSIANGLNFKSGALSFLSGMYTPDEFNWGLVIVTSLIWTFGFFFLLITWGNFSEIISARVPGWSVLFWSAFVTLLVSFGLTFVVPVDDPFYKNANGTSLSNFTTSMRWAEFGIILALIVLISAYLITRNSNE